jgi:hypothetical protein
VRDKLARTQKGKTAVREEMGDFMCIDPYKTEKMLEQK